MLDDDNLVRDRASMYLAMLSEETGNQMIADYMQVYGDSILTYLSEMETHCWLSLYGVYRLSAYKESPIYRCLFSRWSRLC